jgi:hypothetical protein
MGFRDSDNIIEPVDNGNVFDLAEPIDDGNVFDTDTGATAISSTSEAAASAFAAANAADGVTLSETNAAASAAAAAISEANASTSENNSSTSESNAATSETNAATSAANASTSETNSASSALAAASSESNAATSATASANSATASANSASLASTSESNAATSESNASSFAQSALSSLTSVTNIFDSFDDRYLGSKTSDPTLDNDGNTLIIGTIYWNSTEGELKFYNGTIWEAPSAAAATSATNAATSESNAATSATASATSATASETSNVASNTAKLAAQAAQTAAELAETNAETAETNASTQATNASTSANNAATSESNAATSATASQTSATASQVSRLAAETAETNAETAETNAAASETAASTSETNAATSASTASTGATTATTKASEAATSATNAATSETNAETAETNAETAETNASIYATNAATSATNSATSATSSDTARAASVVAKVAAETAETNAETAEANALASKNAAATSATNSANSAAEASTSENNAAVSAATATTKASESSTSATAAAASATSASASKDAALAALDSFDDRYLGQKSSDPTVDNDGDALVAGALYFNTTDSVMKVYEGSVWVSAYTSLSEALLISQNLSDLNDIATARTNLGVEIGTDVQAYSSVLAATTASYTTAINTKINNIETNADVTDVTNVTAAGALMDSEVTNLDQVKAFNSSDYVSVSGDSITGNLSFGDNDKAIFGAGSDLQIYHDGSNSYIKDNGTGNLRINAGELTLTNAADNQNRIVTTSDGTVYLYNGGSIKLATTSTGVDITGTLTSDGLTVDGSGVEVISVNSTQNGAQINFDSASTSVDWSIGVSNSADGDFLIYQSGSGSGDINLYTGGLKRQEINRNGDISFYEATGTTPKFFWDADAESLGIGVSSISNIVGTGYPQLQVGGSVSGIIDITSGSNLGIRMSADGNLPTIASRTQGWPLRFSTTPTGGSATERMRIDSSGNVGIGVAPYSWSNLTALQLERASVSGGDPDTYFTSNGYYSTTAPSGWKYGSATTATQMYMNASGGEFVFRNATSGTTNASISWSEAMRIDSSGNLLVGKTSANNTTAGTTIYGSAPGNMSLVRDSGSSIVMNRLNSDGDIAVFRKNGTTVGSIGSEVADTTLQTDLYIHGRSTVGGSSANNSRLWLLGGDSGIVLDGHTNAILPTDENSYEDARTDIGSADYRFKDLYLSGTVNANSVDLGSFVVTETNGHLYFSVGGVNKMKLDSSGNLQVVGNVDSNATIT